MRGVSHGCGGEKAVLVHQFFSYNKSFVCNLDRNINSFSGQNECFLLLQRNICFLEMNNFLSFRYKSNFLSYQENIYLPKTFSSVADNEKSFLFFKKRICFSGGRDFSWVGTYSFFPKKEKLYSSNLDMTFFAKKGKCRYFSITFCSLWVPSAYTFFYL